MPSIEHCWFVAGEETFVVKVRVPDVHGLEQAIRELNGIRGVARTRTTVVLSTKFEDRVQVSAPTRRAPRGAPRPRRPSPPDRRQRRAART